MPDPARIVVAELARQLANGYYAFVVAHLVAVNPKSINSLPDNGPPGRDPEGELKRLDGTAHKLNLRHYLDLLRENRDVQSNFLKLYATGAFLNLGNELQRHHYFDHSPLLELIYHLRNGVAHGNAFHIDKHGLERLAKYPAHNKLAPVRSPQGTTFEVTAQSTGPILFDFLGSADVIDLLQSVEVSLSR